MTHILTFPRPHARNFRHQHLHSARAAGACHTCAAAPQAHKVPSPEAMHIVPAPEVQIIRVPQARIAPDTIATPTA